jgi:hypothetical protein
MCLNEEQESNGKKIFKPEDQKLNDNGIFVSSDDPDAELIFIIPFFFFLFRIKKNNLNYIFIYIYILKKILFIIFFFY